MNRRKLLGPVAALLVVLSIGIYFHLNSPSATAKLMEPQCYLTVAEWLGERPLPPLRTPYLEAGVPQPPIVSEAFDAGYYEILIRHGGFRAGGEPVMIEIQKYIKQAMPSPFPELCHKISLHIARACKSTRGDKVLLGQCFAEHLAEFRFGLGRFHRGYLDDPELREKVEEMNRIIGL